MSRDVTTSIVIPAHGHAGMTAHCVTYALQSIAGRDDVEIVVVDDASDPPIILPSGDARVRVLRSETNTGFAGACNRGAQAATGEDLVFLNSDTEPRGDWLGALQACRAGDVAIVGARLLYRDGTTQHAGICFSEADGQPRHVYRGFLGDHRVVTASRRMQAVTAACMLVTASAFSDLGGFDEAYVNGFEDVDLCLRAQAAGIGIAYCGATDITHLESVTLRTSEGPSDAERSNRARFEARWGDVVERDELRRYVADGLIAFHADDVYPLSVRIDPLLGRPETDDIAGLLNVRSRQVFDLEKEVGALAAQLLDHGIEPGL